MKTDGLTQSLLKEFLTYNPITGSFTANHDSKKHSTRKAGRELGHLHNSGYKMIIINQVSFLAHRLGWLFVHGSLPKPPLMLDHIDRNKTNNAISNLRVVTRSENFRNVGLQTNNKSGYKGVSFEKNCNKWRAQIRINNKYTYLGVFETKEEAIKARKQAEIDYNYYEVKEK